MIKEKITYSESIETFHSLGLKKWRRAEMSATIDPNENPLDCLAELKRDVQSFLQSPPEVPIEDALSGVLPQPVDHKEKRILERIMDIEACTSVSNINGFGAETGLLAFEKTANEDARIKAAYDLKMIQLKQKQ